MTLPVIVAYGIFFLIVSAFVRILVAGLILPRLQAWSRARARDVIARFHHAYSQGQLDIDARLYLAVNDAMIAMVRDADSLALPMLVRYRPVLPEWALDSDHSLHSRMERHPDERVRSFHREWSEAVLAIIMANSPGVVIYVPSLVILLSPILLIIGIWRVLRRPAERPKLRSAAIFEWVTGLVARNGRVVYRNA